MGFSSVLIGVNLWFDFKGWNHRWTQMNTDFLRAAPTFCLLTVAVLFDTFCESIKLGAR